MRFESELAGRRGVIAVIHLNKQSQVIGEHLEFDDPNRTGFSLSDLVEDWKNQKRQAETRPTRATINFPAAAETQ
jgi:hypothetical protein